MSFESRLIFPRRDMKLNDKNFTRLQRSYEMQASILLEKTALALLEYHRKHLSSYCAGMGTTSFYRRRNWLGEADRTPIMCEQDSPNKTIWRDIQKWQRDFLTPYTENYGYGFRPLRAEYTEAEKVYGVQRYTFDIKRNW